MRLSNREETTRVREFFKNTPSSPDRVYFQPVKKFFSAFFKKDKFSYPSKQLLSMTSTLKKLPQEQNNMNIGINLLLKIGFVSQVL